MSENLDENWIKKALDWVYDQAVEGVVGLESAEQLAENFLKEKGSVRAKVDKLIFWQKTKAATSGFLSGLGGILTMPVALPANITSVMYIQVRMIAAIAHMGGYDIRDDRVRTLAYVCLCGNGAKDILKEVGIKLGTKLTEQVIKKLSFEVIKNINKAVGFRLITKFGQKGIINLGKGIPFIGGLIGGALDVLATAAIANAARKTFIHRGRKKKGKRSKG